MNLETQVAFIDYEKAFDRLCRRRLWQILIRRGFALHLVRAIQSLYTGTTIRIDLGKRRLSQEVVINQSVRQGCSFSASFFNMYIDVFCENG